MHSGVVLDVLVVGVVRVLRVVWLLLLRFLWLIRQLCILLMLHRHSLIHQMLEAFVVYEALRVLRSLLFPLCSFRIRPSYTNTTLQTVLSATTFVPCTFDANA